jgi:NAD(P)-dependent dehydrogenase (short-subunit alcohol dehydrogenase family)
MPSVKQRFDLEGQTALVTGGSRGLGREIAEGLMEAGASVMLLARRREAELKEAALFLASQASSCITGQTIMWTAERRWGSRPGGLWPARSRPKS